MKTKLILLFLFYCLTTTQSFSQKFYSNWFFGNKTGLNFSYNNVSVLNNSWMVSFEACASISDIDGNVLFYTNGVKVWNKNDIVMSNGYNLSGSLTSTNIAIIKEPNSSNLYYIISIGSEFYQSSLTYSIIDMDLNSGLGDVTIDKNILVKDSLDEKICVVKHANNVDYWIITYDIFKTEFNSHLLTEFGINNTPVISSFPPPTTVSYSNAGQLKCNKKGNRIASAIWQNSFIELYNFDNNTGILSTKQKINGFVTPYGLEFSSNSKHLYISDIANYNISTDSSVVYQINIDAGNLTQIQSSKTIIHKSLAVLGQLQIGPYNKIYISKYQKVFLDVIENPNNKNTSCNYIENSIFLVGGQALFGLPSVPNDAYNYTYNSSRFCFGDVTKFEFLSSFTDSIKWNFGDKNSNQNNSENDVSYHLYSKTGSYFINAIIYTHDFIDTIFDTINILTSPELKLLTKDTVLCNSESLTIEFDDQKSIYEWENGSKVDKRIIKEEGLYYVTVENVCGKTSDSINVNYKNCNECRLSIADAFTPNNDGLNDFFFPIEESNKKIINFRIFNRWGKILHNEVTKWDGSFKSNKQESDAYYYTYTVECDDLIRKYTGEFFLIK